MTEKLELCNPSSKRRGEGRANPNLSLTAEVIRAAPLPMSAPPVVAVAADGVELQVADGDGTVRADRGVQAAAKSPSSKPIFARGRKRGGMCCTISKENRNCLVLFVIWWILLIIGGAIFSAIESPEEDRLILEADAQRAEYADFVNQLLSNATLRASLNETTLMSKMEGYSGVLNLDYKNKHWFFSKALLFSFTIVTTIGYGTFAPVTVGGRLFLVLYALLGIPLAGLTLSTVAKRGLHMVTLLFTIKTDKVLEAFNHYDEDGSGELDVDEFRAALDDLGIKVTEAQFDRVVNAIDQNGDEKVDRDEFEHAVKMLDADVSDAAGRGRRIKVVIFSIVAWMFIGTGYFTL